MKNFRDLLNEELKNPEFKKEWDALEEEYKLIRQKLDAEDKFLMRHSVNENAVVKTSLERENIG